MAPRNLMEVIRACYKRLVATLQGSTVDSFSAGPVLDAETITYFVRTSKHVDPKTQSIRPEAFMPRRIEQRLETSIYRISGLTEQQVWEVCKDWYEARANLTAKGRGDGPAASVTVKAGLHFDPDGKPHPRHANIVGWFDQSGLPYTEMKHQWMQTARRFSGDFSFIRRP